MDFAQGVRKHGFHRWHGLALLYAHGWLIVTLLAAAATFAALEMAIKRASLLAQLASATASAIFGALALIALYRFLDRLLRAQRAAAQAHCPGCKAFGHLTILSEETARIHVRCLKCGHSWGVDDT